MLRKIKMIGFLGLVAMVVSCASASQHHKSLPSTKEREMTIGLVQKEIREGMAQADVAEVLGSPNIVTRDSAGKETWIYDKVASDASYSRSHGFLTLILFGVSRDAGATSSTQRTLTIIIKFNDAQAVESFSYHTSKF